MARVWLIFGGVLALISLLFTWWFSYYSTSSFHSLEPMITLIGNSSKLINNISPIEEGGSPGVQISQTSFGINYMRYSFLLQISILLVILGGVLGIAIGLSGIKYVHYGICTGILVLAAVALFMALLVLTSGFSLLGGTKNVFGIMVIWGLGPGVLLALISAFLMISDHMLRGK